MLADHAAVADGKLFISGAGWTQIGPQPSPFALALIIEVPWSEANRRHKWSLVLQGEDGLSVHLPAPGGETPVAIEGEFEVGRPPGLREGGPLEMPLAVNVGPLPLEPGRRYQWRLFVNNDTREYWVRGFTVRPSS